MIKPSRNIWILGGTGFIGSALVRLLSHDKANRLHLLVHKRAHWRLLEGFSTFTGTLSGIEPGWFERYPPDIVYHLARPAGSNALTRKLRSATGERANRRLVKILRSLPATPVVVYVSGSLMYGDRPDNDPAFENSPLSPESFARYYYRNELPWIEAQGEGSLDVRFARPGWIAGPGSWFMEFFYKPWRHTGRVPCYGEGTQRMSLTDLDDCAAMIHALGQYGSKGSNLNIFSGDIITQLDFSNTLARMLNAETEMIPENRLRQKYGKVTAAALLSSSPMGTLYPELHHRAGITIRDPEQLLASVVGLSENKQGVFAELP
ncbi:MAG: NAD(P)-dependent oxidoreductase [Marinilabiliales bacterium]|nr:MAG: NAD(P)-dependent oxidoreductase [Marinilabiliales bacterium]